MSGIWVAVKELRAADAELAGLTDLQLVAFVRSLVEALSEHRARAENAVWGRLDRPQPVDAPGRYAASTISASSLTRLASTPSTAASERRS